MVRRIVALLLLGVWQLQGAVPPHLHAGMSADELIAHGARRHVHLSHESHAHHDHAHQHADHRHGGSHSHATPFDGHLATSLALPPNDHDHDVVYLTQESLAKEVRTSATVAPPGLATFATSVDTVTSPFEQHTSAPPRYGGQVPAFLGTTRLLL